MSEQTRLDLLLLRYEELRAQGTSIAAEELCQECPELLPELQRQLHILQSMSARLGSEASASAAVTATRPEAPGSGPSGSWSTEALCTGSRYQVLRFHAKGGLGEVHVARDEELHRDVALKRLQAVHAGKPHSRERFLREAAITSRLEHPSIVPVHSMGQDADGCPFYAMRFIHGQTLQEAIDQFHAADRIGRDSGERRLALRQLLGRVVAVCYTLAYAHSKGIVHRDIKPDNIMLGPYGETLVVDWGLAKEVGAREGEGTPALPSASSPESGAAAPAHAPVATHTGEVVGTPTYMSPEQAEGLGNLVGPASDVYSLGVTLYTVLTGQALFEGRRFGELLDKVKRGEFTPPRQRNKTIPAPLEAICLKAMACRPEQRYATALDVAADLEHWLADEPVSAWPEPWTARARRWLGRHRTLATAVAAAVVVATATSVVGLVLLAASNERERLARIAAQEKEREAQEQRHEAERQQIVAETQKEKANANFKLARDAVDQYLRNITQDPRLREYDLEGLRKELLRAAAKFYDAFANESSTDLDLLAEQGKAYQQLGVITQEIASKAEAITFFQRALDIFERLTRTNPAEPKFQRELASTHHRLAAAYDLVGRPDQAEAACEHALRIRTELATQQPGEADYQNELAESHGYLGVLCRKAGRLKPGETAYQKAVDIGTELVRRHPNVSDYKSTLARNQLNFGSFSWEIAHRPKESEEHLRQSLALWQELVQVEPSKPQYQSQLATVHQNLGVLYGQLGQLKQAETSYQEALAIRDKLSRDHPTVSDYRNKLARTYVVLGYLYLRNERPAEAEAAYRKSLEINEQLARDHPTIADYTAEYGRSYGHLGYLMRESNPQAALDWLGQGIRILEALVQQFPQHTDARLYLGSSHWEQAQILTRLGRHGEALQDADRALEVDDGRNRIAWSVGRALLRARSGAHARASMEINTAIAQAPQQANTLYAAACGQALCALAVRRDQQLPATEQSRLAEQYAVRAVELLTKARAAGFFRSPVTLKLLSNDPDLESLRSRADFKQFVNEVGDKGTTSAK